MHRYLIKMPSKYFPWTSWQSTSTTKIYDSVHFLGNQSNNFKNTPKKILTESSMALGEYSRGGGGINKERITERLNSLASINIHKDIPKCIDQWWIKSIFFPYQGVWCCFQTIRLLLRQQPYIWCMHSLQAI